MKRIANWIVPQSPDHAQSRAAGRLCGGAKPRSVETQQRSNGNYIVDIISDTNNKKIKLQIQKP